MLDDKEHLSVEAQETIGRALWEMFSTSRGLWEWDEMSDAHKEAWRGYARMLPLEEVDK